MLDKNSHLRWKSAALLITEPDHLHQSLCGPQANFYIYYLQQIPQEYEIRSFFPLIQNLFVGKRSGLRGERHLT